MKNRDLIKQLLNYNLDADVTTVYSEDIYVSWICRDADGNLLTRESTTQLFIEGCDDCTNCSHQYMNEEEDLMWCQHYDKPCDDVGRCEVLGDMYI